jgi:hypothetical protein
VQLSTDEIVGLGRLFADDTSIGHIAQDESTLRNMINTIARLSESNKTTAHI